MLNTYPTVRSREGANSQSQQTESEEDSVTVKIQNTKYRITVKIQNTEYNNESAERQARKTRRKARYKLYSQPERQHSPRRKCRHNESNASLTNFRLKSTIYKLIFYHENGNCAMSQPV